MVEDHELRDQGEAFYEEILGCDFHPSRQQIAVFDRETGEITEHKLMNGDGEAEAILSGAGSASAIECNDRKGCSLYIYRRELLQLWGHDCVITIRDIAKATGLSTATVSMVLNQSGRRIPPITQKFVQETALKLGYFPNLQARSLRSNRTHSIGVLVFDITDPYCGLVIRGIENSLESAGYMPVLADLQNTPKRLHRCLEMLMGRRVEGIIAIANPIHLGAELAAALTQFKIPAVVIGSQPESKRYSSVTIDNTAGSRSAIEHLYSLGHRSIAVIKGPKAMTDSAPRWNGIRDYARRKGIPIDKSLVVEIRGNNSSYEEGYGLTQQLMHAEKPFSGLIAFDDLTAFAAIGALSSAGRGVPDDCSVVGFDDIPGAAFYNPPLTTICQHLEEQGSLSAEIMQKQLLSKNAASRNKMQKTIEPNLIIRKSTAPLSKNAR